VKPRATADLVDKIDDSDAKAGMRRRMRKRAPPRGSSKRHGQMRAGARLEITSTQGAGETRNPPASLDRDARGREQSVPRRRRPRIPGRRRGLGAALLLLPSFFPVWQIPLRGRRGADDRARESSRAGRSIVPRAAKSR
jgi:hypothetical protein